MILEIFDTRTDLDLQGIILLGFAIFLIWLYFKNQDEDFL